MLYANAQFAAVVAVAALLLLQISIVPTHSYSIFPSRIVHHSHSTNSIKCNNNDNNHHHHHWKFTWSPYSYKIVTLQSAASSDIDDSPFSQDDSNDKLNLDFLIEEADDADDDEASDDADDTDDADDDDSEDDEIDGFSTKSPNIDILATPTVSAKQKMDSWESRFEADPMKANAPTRDWEPPVESLTNWYVALADASDSDLRSEAWTHHLQWVRRSNLRVNSTAKVVYDLTRLDDHGMSVAGQVLVLRSNDSKVVLDLLSSEPLSNHGGVSAWKLFELDNIHDEEALSTAKDPTVFVGLDKKIDKAAVSKTSNYYDDDNKLVNPMPDEQKDYHLKSGRIIALGGLTPVRKGIDGNSDGVFVYYNAPTNGDAMRYIDADPIACKKPYGTSMISRVNEQDIDGLHHMMARSFYDKTVLDLIHFMDPEDILLQQVPVLKSLPNHSDENMKVIEQLKELSISYRYTRFDEKERYGDANDMSRAATFNAGLDAFQSARLQSASDLYMDAEMSTDTSMEESGSDE